MRYTFVSLLAALRSRKAAEQSPASATTFPDASNFAASLRYRNCAGPQTILMFFTLLAARSAFALSRFLTSPDSNPRLKDTSQVLDLVAWVRLAAPSALRSVGYRFAHTG